MAQTNDTNRDKTRQDEMDTDMQDSDKATMSSDKNVTDTDFDMMDVEER